MLCDVGVVVVVIVCDVVLCDVVVIVCDVGCDCL